VCQFFIKVLNTIDAWCNMKFIRTHILKINKYKLLQKECVVI